MRLGFPLIIGISAVVAIGIFLLMSKPDSPELPLADSQLTLEQQQGRALASSYCSDCHATGTEGNSKHPIAPQFRKLHQRYDVSQLSEALVEGFFTHPDMPEFEFDADQAESIIVYLEYLQLSDVKSTQ